MLSSLFFSCLVSSSLVVLLGVLFLAAQGLWLGIG
jgi:hypothetical protein